MLWPDFDEFQMRGTGWGAVVPVKSMITTKDMESYFGENYKRTKDGRRVPSKPVHRKVRVRPDDD
jgi:hypothetical protein